MWTKRAHPLDRTEGPVRLGNRSAVRAGAGELALANVAACRTDVDITDLIGPQIAVLSNRALGAQQHIARQWVGAGDRAGGDRFGLQAGQRAIDIAGGQTGLVKLPKGMLGTR